MVCVKQKQASLFQKRILHERLQAAGVRADGEGEDHGAFLTVKHPNASDLASELEERGLEADARGDRLRLCPDILNGAAELERAAALIGSLANQSRLSAGV